MYVHEIRKDTAEDADPVSGDMYFDVEKLSGYIETAKGGKWNA